MFDFKNIKEKEIVFLHIPFWNKYINNINYVIY